jgi:hypothetical protein
VSYTVTGPATVSGSTLTITGAGTVTVTASQTGNTNYAAATPVSQSFTVAPAALTVTANNASRAYGAANPVFGYTITGFVNTDTSSVVSGTATETTAATTTSAAGTYPITFTTHSLTAANYTFTYVSGTLTVSGGAAQTITFGAIATQTVGTSLTLTASASSGLGVTFASNTPSICTVSGTTATLLSAGSCSITASQAGNSTFAVAKQVTQSFAVNLKSQAITFPAISAQTMGTPLALSATANSGLTVSFASNTPSICTVSGTTATLLSAGSCSITASQAGNGTYAAATPVTQSFTVSAAANSKVTLQFASTQLVYPGVTNVTVCVASAASSTASGSVKIYDGTTLLTTLVLGGNGCSYWNISPGLSAGTHVLTAVYSGDSKHPSGTSAATTLTVNPVPTWMSVSCWNASFAYGGSYQCMVSMSSNAGAPLGSITYSFDNGAAVTVPLRYGNAQFTIATPASGKHHVVMTYAQQTNYAAAASQTETFTVTPAPVHVELIPSRRHAKVGTDISFAVAVTSWNAAPPDATGTVSFYNGTTLLGAVPVNSRGQATYSTAGLAVGSHKITATYAGSGNYASGSNTVYISVHAGK